MKNTKKKIVTYSSVMLVLIISVIIKAEIIKNKRDKNTISILSEWLEKGKPVNVINIKKSEISRYIKVSGLIKSNSIFAHVSLGKMNKLKKGQKFNILDQENKARYGTVAYISNKVSEKFGLYRVILKLNKKSNYKLNSIVVARVETAKIRKIIKIPQEAIIKNSDKNYVWVINNNIARIKQIKIAYSNDEYSQIINGLKINSVVVINGFNVLEEGDRVRVISREEMI